MEKEQEILQNEARARILGIVIPETPPVESKQSYTPDDRDEKILKLERQVRNLESHMHSLLGYVKKTKHLVEFDDKLKEIRRMIN